MIQRILLSLCILMLSGLQLKAAEEVVLHDGMDSFELIQKYVLIYEDETGSLGINQIAQLPDSLFTYSKLYNDNKNSTYWIKFVVSPELNKNKKWVLEVLDSRHNEIELYSHDQNGFKLMKSGIDYPFAQRAYAHKNFVLDLDFSNKEKNIFYVKCKSRLVGSLLFKIRTNQEFSSYAFNEYYLLGTYYGILIIIALYNLIIFFATRERIYLFYVFYVLVWAWRCMLDDGIGYQYFWNSIPEITTIGFIFSKPLLISFFVLYSRLFLNISNFFPKTDQLIGVFLATYVVSDLFLQFIGINFSFVTLLFAVPFIIIYYISIRIYNQGFEPARFFILGNSFIVVGVVIKVLKDIGFTDSFTDNVVVAIIGVYGMNIGMILEIIIMSMALGDRINYYKRKEKEAQDQVIEQLKINEALGQKVNKELELKVRERTAELIETSEALKQANLQLAKQAEEISRWNQVLDLDNHKLKKEVKDAIEARIKFKDILYDEFLKIFPDDLSCQRYIEEIKWKDGYKCRRCGNEKFCKGNKKFSRRCTRCRYDESVTAYTFLHKCKFPLVKAFYIMAKVNKHGDDINCNQVAKELDMRKNTVWEFKKKLLEAMAESKKGKQNQEESLDYIIYNSFN
ncbi:MAG: 7TM diverse intracellular signaling domain-containing protein [Cytophagaceae bacterium]